MKTTRTLIATAVMAAGLALTHTLSAEEHREIIAMDTERQLIDIEVDVLLEKFSELTKRVHQLDLERTSLEVEAEFESNETERDELATQLKKVSALQDRLEEKRHQTRDEICLLYTSPSPRDVEESRMPSSA